MKRHPIDSVSLVFALLFAAAVAWWAVAALSDDPLHVPAAWVGAGTLLIIGLVGLISALRPQREQVAAGPMTVAPEPPTALTPDPDLYSDPYFEATTLTRADVLDADAIAAAYREAGFEDPEARSVPLTAKPQPRPAGEPTPTVELPATDDSAPTQEVPATDHSAPTEELPAAGKSKPEETQ